MTDSQPSVPARLELPARALSGVVMGATAVAAVAGGTITFAAILAAGAIAGLREWHRLVNAGPFLLELMPTALSVLGVLSLAHLPNGVVLALLAIALGAGGAALVTGMRRTAVRPGSWHGFGAFYLGLPVLALALLREEPEGAALVGGLFVAVWTADTGALIFGRWIGGPKLAPDLSPNKTWAGFLGGTLLAGLGEAIYMGVIDGSVVRGAIFGIILALAGHAGDLFESWVKRQFRAKNTGQLIPGHGGMLDRIDSLLFAAPACAVLVFLIGFDPLNGGNL